MNRILAGAALLSTLFFTSCKKDSLDTPDPSIHQTYAHGASVGTAASKTIGPEGGTLTTADGGVALSIPAGAVSKATEFSIQKVENTFPAARSESFRLLPEGTEFAKPVTLRFSYQNFQLEGTAPEALFLSYQDADGHYWLASKTTLNPADKTLAVETTHFSDWQICETYRVVADRTTLKRGEKATLKLQEVDMVAPLVKSEIPIQNWVDYSPGEGEKVSWSLVGEGKLDPAGPTCGYTAPNVTPAQNPVLVNLTFSGFLSTLPGRASTQMIMITPIEIADGQYVKYSFDGQTLDITGDCESGCITGEMRNGNFYLRTTAGGNRVLELVVRNFGGRPGNYPFHTEISEVEVWTGFGTPRYISSYSSCESPYNSVQSSGGVNITKWGKAGEYIEGNINTQLYERGVCGGKGKPFTCRFRFQRER